MAQTNVQAFSGDVEISGETVLGTATYRKRRDWDRNALAYVYLGNVTTNNTTGIRLDVSLNNSTTGYQMFNFQITLQGNDDSHAGGKLVYSVQGTKNDSESRAVDIGYVYVGSPGSFEYQLWLKDPTTDTTGDMDAYLNCQGYYNFDTGVSDVAQGGAAPTNFQDGVVGVLVDSAGNVGIGTTSPGSALEVVGTVTATTFSGALEGNADTATALATARTINGVSFDGSGGIVVEPYISEGNTGDTTCYLTFTQDTTAGYKRLYEDSALVYNNTNNKLTTTTFSGALEGNADTATALATARTINGVSFDGSANITAEPYISDDNTGDTNCYLVFTQNTTAGYKRLYEDSGLVYDNTNNQINLDSLQITDYIYHSGDTNSYFGFNGNDHIAFVVAGATRLQVDSTGYVGIGTGTANVPLRIQGGSAPGFVSQNLRWLTNYNINLTREGEVYPATQLPSSSAIGLYSQQAIGTQTYLYSQGGGLTGSDVRIKKDIIDIDDGEALRILRLLQPKQYKYKDTLYRSEDPVWGFIAQEVAEVLPYSVNLQTEYIPNIMEIVEVSNSNIITFSNFNTSNLESNATSLRIRTFEALEHDVNIVEIIDENSIRVDDDLTPYLRSLDESGNLVIETTTTVITPEEYTNLGDSEKNEYTEESNTYVKTSNTFIGSELFVFGQEVDNFNFLKKESIFTITTTALQEVDRLLQAETAKVATLNTQLTSVLARLDALESA